MARIKLGALVSDIAGSIGGTTFQRNSYGLSARNKPYSNTSFTEICQNRRANMEKVQKLWREMQPYQREVFERYSQFHPQFSKGNKGSLLNGYNLFVKYSLLFFATDNAPQVNPKFIVPVIEPSPAIARIGALGLYVDINVNPGAAIFQVLAKASRPYSNLTAIPRNMLRVCKVAFNQSAKLYIYPDYEFKFGRQPVDGEYIRVAFTVMSFQAPVIYNCFEGVIQVLNE